MNTNLRLAVTGCLLATTGIFLRTHYNQKQIPARPAFVSFPHRLGSWSGQDAVIPKEVLEVLGAGDFLSRVYQKNLTREGDVDLFMAYFPSQATGDTLHSPRNCLPGSGWLPLESGRTTISVPGFVPFPANRYVIAKGSDRRLVLYWYLAHGRALASEYWVKFYLVANSIRFNRSDGSLIRIITQIRSGETTDEAQERLVSFAGQLVPQVGAYVQP